MPLGGCLGAMVSPVTSVLMSVLTRASRFECSSLQGMGLRHRILCPFFLRMSSSSDVLALAANRMPQHLVLIPPPSTPPPADPVELGPAPTSGPKCRPWRGLPPVARAMERAPTCPCESGDAGRGRGGAGVGARGAGGRPGGLVLVVDPVPLDRCKTDWTS
jgi:hypothetical protein